MFVPALYTVGLEPFAFVGSRFTGVQSASKREIIMARGDQLARQWKIFQKLVSSRYGKSVSDLARDLGCHKRTVEKSLHNRPGPYKDYSMVRDVIEQVEKTMPA
jgi:hypothetical protein